MAFDESKATYKQIISRVKALKEELETGKDKVVSDLKFKTTSLKEFKKTTDLIW